MLDFFSEIFNKFASWLVSVLPYSPFTDVISSISDLPYLKYLNWFIPIGTILKIFVIYLSAVSLFYIYSVIARWVKLLSD